MQAGAEPEGHPGAELAIATATPQLRVPGGACTAMPMARARDQERRDLAARSRPRARPASGRRGAAPWASGAGGPGGAGRGAGAVTSTPPRRPTTRQVSPRQPLPPGACGVPVAVVASRRRTSLAERTGGGHGGQGDEGRVGEDRRRPERPAERRQARDSTRTASSVTRSTAHPRSSAAVATHAARLAGELGGEARDAEVDDQRGPGPRRGRRTRGPSARRGGRWPSSGRGGARRRTGTAAPSGTGRRRWASPRPSRTRSPGPWASAPSVSSGGGVTWTGAGRVTRWRRPAATRPSGPLALASSTANGTDAPAQRRPRQGAEPAVARRGGRAARPASSGRQGQRPGPPDHLHRPVRRLAGRDLVGAAQVERDGADGAVGEDPVDDDAGDDGGGDGELHLGRR